MGIDKKWNISIGFLEKGPRNLISDVEGVTVGHCTLADGDVQTGVTALCKCTVPSFDKHENEKEEILKWVSETRINLDTLHTRNKEKLLLQDCFEKQESFVVDNTNPTAEDRKRYIEPAIKHGYRIVGYYFKSAIRDCVDRNEKRKGKAKVPSHVIANIQNKLEMPSYEERQDKIMIDNSKYIPMDCPVCGEYYFSELDENDLELYDYIQCPQCGWKYDLEQTLDPENAKGLNNISLEEFRTRYTGRKTNDPSYNYRDDNNKAVPHLCLVCGRHTFPDEGSFEICPICGWQDDSIMEKEPDRWAGSSNELCLNDYKNGINLINSYITHKKLPTGATNTCRESKDTKPFIQVL